MGAQVIHHRLHGSHVGGKFDRTELELCVQNSHRLCPPLAANKSTAYSIFKFAIHNSPLAYRLSAPTPKPIPKSIHQPKGKQPPAVVYR
jgi:hypothetical protein